MSMRRSRKSGLRYKDTLRLETEILRLERWKWKHPWILRYSCPVVDDGWIGREGPLLCPLINGVL